MTRSNITLQLESETIKRARVVAAKRGTSVSALVARELESLVARAERYEQAHRRALELFENAAPGGGRSWTRDDIYAERLDRHAR